MIPTHNSTLGLDIARRASVKHGLPSAIFSLEMSKTEITMRLLSAEARVPLHHMRSGTMTDDDWSGWPGAWARSRRRRSTSTTRPTSR
jgi:replicative DNA helicase